MTAAPENRTMTGDVTPKHLMSWKGISPKSTPD